MEMGPKTGAIFMSVFSADRSSSPLIFVSRFDKDQTKNLAAKKAQVPPRVNMTFPQ